MTKYKFKNDMPENLIDLKKKMFDLGTYISQRSTDTGFKGGIKTTSYSFDLDNMTWSGWDSDDERYRQLSLYGVPVYKFFDCYTYTELIFEDEQVLLNLFNEFVK